MWQLLDNGYSISILWVLIMVAGEGWMDSTKWLGQFESCPKSLFMYNLVSLAELYVFNSSVNISTIYYKSKEWKRQSEFRNAWLQYCLTQPVHENHVLTIHRQWILHW